MQDISQRRRAEAELASTHRELLDASRRAGQAEVATSVLHNVGNVLNSVIVSSTVASERLRSARFANVRLAAEMLAENRSSLGSFFSEHPKGRLFLPYLQQLGTMLESERETALNELGAVVKHIEHIKEIVARQQSYAGTGGVLEKVRLAEIVEHALELNADSLDRHAVKIERAFADVPAFAVDKHRVLQILVNLVRNAKDALKAGPSTGERRLQIELTEQPGTVAVRVSDNGIGIAPENLTRIFQHGFTTRRDGHGFGLHSGALAAAQLGGRLFAHSPGPDGGATFTLELPFRQEDA